MNPTSSQCVIQAIAFTPLPRMDLEGNGSNELEEDAVTFVCELDPIDTHGYSGLSFPLRLDGKQKEAMMNKLKEGEIISNESTLLFTNGIQLSDDGMYVSSPDLDLYPGSKNVKQKDSRLFVTGDKNLLVVKVIDVNGLAVAESLAQISDDVFGSFSNPVNLKSQMSACSFGKVNFIPGAFPESAGDNADSPGVIEVNIPISLTASNRYDVANAVTTAVQEKLGTSLPGPYQHVMCVLESCYVGCGWKAYAQVNGWQSISHDEFYKHVRTQMHGKCLLCMLVLSVAIEFHILIHILHLIYSTWAQFQFS